MACITHRYYEENAEQYIAGTVNLDVTHLYTDFLKNISPYGHILDAGCGSGRDTLYFLQHGYEVSAFDRSSSLVESARLRTGIDVKVLSFEDMDYKDVFDGIWACASLLHTPLTEIPTIINKLRAALKPNGVLYCSFKQGLEDWTDAKGRFFVGMTEEKLKALLEHCGFTVLVQRMEISARQECWISAIGQKG
ncbi:MAG: methyltransferase domain-containing protein [Pseudomonadota bacterium]